MILTVLLAAADPAMSQRTSQEIQAWTPAVFDEAAARVIQSIPESGYEGPDELKSALPAETRAWFARLSSVRSSEVALIVMLSYSLPERQSAHAGSRAALAALFLAAQIAAGGESTGTSSERVLDTGSTPASRPNTSSELYKATRALAWGRRLGFCDADFVAILRALPPPSATISGQHEPDFRSAARDLGRLGYNARCTDVAGRTIELKQAEK